MELKPVIVEPRDRRTVLVELCLAQDGVVAASVERHEQTMIRSDFDGTARLNELGVTRIPRVLARSGIRSWSEC